MANSLPITSRSSYANESKIDVSPGSVGGTIGTGGGGIAGVGVGGGGGGGIVAEGEIAGGGISGIGWSGGVAAGGDLHLLHVHHLHGLQNPTGSPSGTLLLHTSQEPRLPHLDTQARIVISACPRTQRRSPAALGGASGDEVTDAGLSSRVMGGGMDPLGMAHEPGTLCCCCRRRRCCCCWS